MALYSGSRLSVFFFKWSHHFARVYKGAFVAMKAWCVSLSMWSVYYKAEEL